MAVLSSVQVTSNNKDDDTLEIVPNSPTDTDDSTSEQGEATPAMESESKLDENDRELGNHTSLNDEVEEALKQQPFIQYSHTNDVPLRERMDCPQEGPQHSIMEPIKVDISCW